MQSATRPTRSRRTVRQIKRKSYLWSENIRTLRHTLVYLRVHVCEYPGARECICACMEFVLPKFCRHDDAVLRADNPSFCRKCVGFRSLHWNMAMGDRSCVIKGTHVHHSHSQMSVEALPRSYKPVRICAYVTLCCFSEGAGSFSGKETWLLPRVLINHHLCATRSYKTVLSLHSASV